MTFQQKILTVLVIDRQSDWRNLAAHALEKAGYYALVADNYGYLEGDGADRSWKPDLVILGCSMIGADEQKLMRRILESRCRLLVLSTSLPPTVMRALFLNGVDDVTDKPYSADQLLGIVREVLEAIAPRDSYQMVESEGAS